ncbi:MAG: hypothetical protein M3008_09345 [Chloroflexota bacterium]|nr:hypothetical protein [Chloroflexota bacterium]
MDTGKRFDPTKYLRTIKVRGGTQQTYLPVTARLLWLRADHPDAQLVTEALRFDEKSAIFKATVTLPSGAVAVGHGSETAGNTGDVGDFIEKAETKAIGRALTALGYGTEFAEGQDDPTLAAATEVAPAAPQRPTEPIALPATTTTQPPQPSATLRPERLSRQQEPVQRTERPTAQPPNATPRIERPASQPEPAERTARAERPERLARQEEPVERPTRPERFAPTPRDLTVERPLRPERIQATERTVVAEEPPRPVPAERTLRPERLSRLQEVTSPTPPVPAPESAAEEMTPTPIRRSGRTLAAGRTFTNAAPTAASAAAAPTPEPSPRPAPRAEVPAEDDADDMEMAMISTTAFWRWAREKGYADRRAVEAATGKSMDAMTPREAYYRLKEMLARESNP